MFVDYDVIYETCFRGYLFYYVLRYCRDLDDVYICVIFFRILIECITQVIGTKFCVINLLSMVWMIKHIPLIVNIIVWFKVYISMYFNLWLRWYYWKIDQKSIGTIYVVISRSWYMIVYSLIMSMCL